MLNFRVLRAWPNWVIVPTVLVLWIFVAVLLAELLGAAPYHQEQ
jgi:ABC-type multidrug transport system permease subunit